MTIVVKLLNEHNYTKSVTDHSSATVLHSVRMSGADDVMHRWDA